MAAAPGSITSQDALTLEELEQYLLKRVSKSKSPSSAQSIFKREVQGLIQGARKAGMTAEKLMQSGLQLSAQAQLELSNIKETGQKALEKNDTAIKKLNKVNAEVAGSQLSSLRFFAPPPPDRHNDRTWLLGREMVISSSENWGKVANVMKVWSFITKPLKKIKKFVIVEGIEKGAAFVCKQTPEGCAKVKEVASTIYHNSGLSQLKEIDEVVAKSYSDYFEIPIQTIQKGQQSRNDVINALLLREVKGK